MNRVASNVASKNMAVASKKRPLRPIASNPKLLILLRKHMRLDALDAISQK
jgi:hypothetical protein